MQPIPPPSNLARAFFSTTVDARVRRFGIWTNGAIHFNDRVDIAPWWMGSNSGPLNLGVYPDASNFWRYTDAIGVPCRTPLSPLASTEPETSMRIITFGILLAVTCQAQVEFVPTRPGNWTPTTPIFGVLYGTASDTIQDRSIKNVGPAPIVITAVSLEIKSPGLEGEWWGGLSIIGLRDYVDLKAQRVQYKKVQYTQTSSLAPNSMAELNVSRLTDCYWDDVGSSCTVDRSVSPPDTLFKHNTANPVDTMDVRLGVYWRDASTSVEDRAYLDCQIEYRTRAHTVVGIQYRGSSPGVARPVGVSGGWRVEAGAWSLRRPDGAEVPVERLAMAQGLVVRPTTAFEGVGILHNADGQAFQVVGVR